MKGGKRTFAAQCPKVCSTDTTVKRLFPLNVGFDKLRVIV